MSKRLGEIKRLQIQNLFMAFKQVPRWVHSIMSGRNPPLYSQIVEESVLQNFIVFPISDGGKKSQVHLPQ